MYLCGNSATVRLFGLTCARISPVYTREAFLPPYPFLIPPSFAIGFPRSPDQTILYHPIMIKVSHSIECWILYLQVCAFISLAHTARLQAQGFPSGIRVLLWWSGQPFLYQIGKAIRRLGVFCLGSVCQLTQMEA